MKNFLSCFIFLVLTSGLLANNRVADMIVPTPQSIKLNNSLFIIKNDISISVSEEGLNFTAIQISNALQNSFGVHPSIGNNSGTIRLLLVDNLDIKGEKEYQQKQAYKLNITENLIEILSETKQGVFYGAMSLIQIIERSELKELPTMEIVDWPDMKIRGISDDISRGQVSNLDNFKRIIDFIARYKMNVYMPYLEDMLEFEEYPNIGKGRGRLSEKEVTEIVKYAKERFIEVIPAFQTLGHFENILTQQEFVDYAEFPGAASLAVTEAKTYVFLENLLDKVFKLFPSEYINIGADESYDVGYGKSKKLTEKIGTSRVHAEHYKKVFNYCKKNGKRVMMYGDVILHHTDILDLIPNDVTIIDWHYGAASSYPSTDIFKNAGFKFIVSPAVWNFRTTFPTYQIAIPNIKTIINDGILNNSEGMINSNWGDYGAETFKEFVLFGYAWSAQCSWNYSGSNIAHFNNSFFYDFFGVDASELNSLYKIFSTQLNQMQWHEVWRHPALELPASAWWASRLNREEIVSWMNWTLPDAYNTIEKYEKLVTKNKEHFDLLRFILHLDYWYQRKLKANYYLTSLIKLNELREELKGGKEDNSEIRDEIISIERRLKIIDYSELADKNISELQNLKNTYRTIWLKYYKEENLNMIMDKFDRLISYFEETKEDVENGRLNYPEISSKWIYAYKRKTLAYKEAEFKREVNIKNPVESAKIQLLADTHAELFINNKFVGEIYSRRSLSLLTEYDRILYLDATKYFKKGKNKIIIKAKSYKGNTGAGINFIAKIRTKNGSFKIISDKNWMSRSLNPKRRWKKSIEKEYRFIVIEPNFETDRTSWIER